MFGFFFKFVLCYPTYGSSHAFHFVHFCEFFVYISIIFADNPVKELILTEKLSETPEMPNFSAEVKALLNCKIFGHQEIFTRFLQHIIKHNLIFIKISRSQKRIIILNKGLPFSFRFVCFS